MGMQGVQQRNTQPSIQARRIQRIGNILGNFLVNHFGLIYTVIFGLILLIAFVDPILSYFGLDAIAKPMFSWMHVLCVQTPSHSFYLYGHQVCLCERCCAIYSSMFLIGFVFVYTKKRLPGMRWWGLVLFSIPIALDGFTQMFGLRESNWELRLLTGALFGMAVSWFVLPLMQRTLETEAALSRQW